MIDILIIYLLFGLVYFLMNCYKLILYLFLEEAGSCEEEAEARREMIVANERLKKITGGHFAGLIIVGTAIVMSCKYFITWPVDFYDDVKRSLL